MSFDLIQICTLMAPYATVVVYASPFPVIQQIRREKNVGQLPLLPYSSMAASSFIWTVYGFLKREPKVWSCCLVGFFLGTYYIQGFAAYAPKSSPHIPGAVSTHLHIVMITILLSLYISKWYPAPDELIGLGAVLFSIAMFASPLSALKHVIATKSAKSIPLPFTMASLLNCFLWSIAGLFQMHDANLYVPNLLGLSFALAQLFLKIYYGDGTKEHNDSSAEFDSLEVLALPK